MIVTYYPHPDLERLPLEFRKRLAYALRETKQYRAGLVNSENTAWDCIGLAAKLEGARKCDMKKRSHLEPVAERPTPCAEIMQTIQLCSGVADDYTPHNTNCINFMTANDHFFDFFQIATLLEGKTVTLDTANIHE